MQLRTIIFCLAFLVSLEPATIMAQTGSRDFAVVETDFSQSDPTIKSQSGFLHGLGRTGPADAQIAPLRPKQVRMGTFGAYDRVIAAGARFQFFLSDAWAAGRQKYKWPYDNYGAWEDFVRATARANKGRTFMWDIWNEPMLSVFWDGSLQQFFETYRRAHDVIRSELGPDVIIGGPSYPKYDREAIRAFLEFCKANRCEVNFLAWHELTPEIPLIADHLAEARRLFLENPNYAALKIQEIQINEVIGDPEKHSPGAIVGTLYYLEKGRSDGSCKACWDDARGVSECFNNSLDGLLTADAKPRSAWWVYKIYADGVASRIRSVTSVPNVVALASRESAQPKQAQVLVGHFKYGNIAGGIDVEVRLKNLSSLFPPGGNRRRINVKIDKIPNSQEAHLPSLSPIRKANVGVVNDAITISLKNFQPDEVMLLTLSN